MRSDLVRFRVPAANWFVAATIPALVALSGCGTGTAGSVPSSNPVVRGSGEPDVGSRQDAAPKLDDADATVAAIVADTDDDSVAKDGAGRTFNGGSSRVDSAEHVSAARQAVVVSAVSRYVSTLPNVSLISVRVADEASDRSRAHVVVASGDAKSDLAVTVVRVPKRPEWRVVAVTKLGLESGSRS